ncbi:hypothetical protein F5887DRAFT_1285151 [Amanita rubescens]|nr:hypothetical protein F5887DRAFT_1285151 [Amanita rubescens]
MSPGLIVLRLLPMISLQYTLLFFALLGASIAAPVQEPPVQEPKPFYPMSNPKNESPWPLTKQNAHDSVGWVYYAHSSNWGQKTGRLPVVIVVPPNFQTKRVIVVEIAYGMSYLEETQKEHASTFFKEGTELSFGKNKFCSLNDDTWINLAKPRIIPIDALFYDMEQKASAQMKPDGLQHLKNVFTQIYRTRFPRKPKPTIENLTYEDIQALINDVAGPGGGTAKQLDRKG